MDRGPNLGALWCVVLGLLGRCGGRRDKPQPPVDVIQMQRSVCTYKQHMVWTFLRSCGGVHSWSAQTGRQTNRRRIIIAMYPYASLSSSSPPNTRRLH